MKCDNKSFGGEIKSCQNWLGTVLQIDNIAKDTILTRENIVITQVGH